MSLRQAGALIFIFVIGIILYWIKPAFAETGGGLSILSAKAHEPLDWWEANVGILDHAYNIDAPLSVGAIVIVGLPIHWINAFDRKGDRFAANQRLCLSGKERFNFFFKRRVHWQRFFAPMKFVFAIYDPRLNRSYIHDNEASFDDLALPKRLALARRWVGFLVYADMSDTQPRPLVGDILHSPNSVLPVDDVSLPPSDSQCLPRRLIGLTEVSDLSTRDTDECACKDSQYTGEKCDRVLPQPLPKIVGIIVILCGVIGALGMSLTMRKLR